MRANMPNIPNRTNEIQKVFSRRVALALRNKGFRVLRTEPNFQKPQYDVYLFENTPELQQAIRNITT